MKTAISIPDDIFKNADRTARKLGISRSELYARAVSEYIEVYGQSEITERLDEVHGQDGEQLDPFFSELQAQIVDDEDW